ncbi:MAG: hypothetical protein M3498_03090, partial [Deinococcota bacterium]|nr:hypothetical protein [Deinococcota bacterium]
MKNALLSLLLTLLLALLVSLAAAQQPASAQQQVTRVVALPFSTSETTAPYGAGMAAALQRGLNTIDNVYVPPVGDALAVAERLQGADRLSPEALAEAFDAAVVVSGQVEASGNQAQILIGLSGPRFPEARDLTVSGPLEDAPELAARVVNEVVRALGLALSGEDRAELDSVLAQTPEFSSLLAVAESALRTQAPNRAQLEVAAQLSPDSSWVLAERARALALAGDLEGALVLAAQATERAPADAEAWVTRGIVTLAAGDREAAL